MGMLEFMSATIMRVLKTYHTLIKLLECIKRLCFLVLNMYFMKTVKFTGWLMCCFHFIQILASTVFHFLFFSFTPFNFTQAIQED